MSFRGTRDRGTRARGRETHTWLEDARSTKGRADSLGEHNLVILRAQAGHHDSEHVQDAADQEQHPWAAAVVDDADEWTLWGGGDYCISQTGSSVLGGDGEAHQAHDEEDLERWDPRDGARGVLPEHLLLVVLLERSHG